MLSLSDLTKKLKILKLQIDSFEDFVKITSIRDENNTKNT